MVPAGNKAKHLLPINHTTKPIHHRHQTKDIQTDLGTLMHNEAYPGIIQAYSKSYATAYSDIYDVYEAAGWPKMDCWIWRLL